MSRTSGRSAHFAEERPGASRALRNSNYRLYLIGQGLSNTGMWTQQTAEMWIILQLTGSGAAVGAHAALRFGPVLLLGAYGGLLSDRVDRRTLLLLTQGGYALLALGMFVYALTTDIALPVLYVTVLGQGLINAVDNPLRRGFVRDLVSDDDLSSAVGLHGSVATLSRAAGPALAGLLISTIGTVWCFAFNALTYGAVLLGVAVIDRRTLREQVFAERRPGQIRDGFLYAWRDRPIRNALAVCFVVAVFGWNWTTLVPFYATEEFQGGASLLGTLLGCISVGSFVGAIAAASRAEVPERRLRHLSIVLAVGLLGCAVAPSLVTAVPMLFLVGLAGTTIIVATQALIQLRVADAYSGRVLAMFSVLFVGSKPIGGLLGGWLRDALDSRWAFAVGASAVLAAVVALGALDRTSRKTGAASPPHSGAGPVGARLDPIPIRERTSLGDEAGHDSVRRTDGGCGIQNTYEEDDEF